MKIEEWESAELQKLSTEQLRSLFQKTNSVFIRNIINGSALMYQQEHIQLLNKISKALQLRNGIPEENN